MKKVEKIFLVLVAVIMVGLLINANHKDKENNEYWDSQFALCGAGHYELPDGTCEKVSWYNED